MVFISYKYKMVFIWICGFWFLWMVYFFWFIYGFYMVDWVRLVVKDFDCNIKSNSLIHCKLKDRLVLNLKIGIDFFFGLGWRFPIIYVLNLWECPLGPVFLFPIVATVGTTIRRGSIILFVLPPGNQRKTSVLNPRYFTT